MTLINKSTDAEQELLKTQILTPRVWENRLVQIGNIFRFARIPARVGEPYKKSPSS